MQLTRLEIKGFKSFGDKITIHFNEGVTAIVGPNGCGKSNVVDAIRWVLGEQSTKALRSEKMENIIFNGTKTRKPANLAEVSLTFDNTKNILPTEFSQVTITRKLYRSGESEYRLNDVACRLKDITDLFLDTGIGNDSYAIIELKMIDEIINNKEHSRRALFEEASGISKYKVRKKQTFNKLRDTEADLNRVDDLLYEIEKNLKTLENQAKKAERYYRLKEQYKNASIQLAAIRLFGFSEALDNLEEQESQQRLGQEGIAVEIARMEAHIQSLKKDSLVEEKNLSTQQRAVNEHNAKIRAYEGEKKVKNEQLRSLTEREQRLGKELAQDRQQINHVHYNLKRLHEEQALEEEKLGQASLVLHEHKAAVDELRGQQQSAKATVDQAAKAVQALQDESYKLEKEITVWQIQRDALLQESKRNLLDTENKELELNEFSSAVDTLETKLEALHDQHEQLQLAEDELQQKMAQKEEELLYLRKELNTHGRALDAKQNEYNLTKSLVDNLEGFPESIRFLRKHAGWEKPHPLLSDVLFCKEQYRIAIENYLEPVMNHYVVPEQADALMAIRLLGDSSRGRASFFVLAAFPAESPARNERTDERWVAALDIIEVEPKYLPLCQHLLRDVYLLTDDGEEGLVSASPSGDQVLLHKTGKFSKTRVSLNGGSVGLFEGKRIGRAKNLEILNKEIKSINQRLEELQERLNEAEAALLAWKAQTQKAYIGELALQLSRTNNELVSVRTKQEQHLSFIHNSQNRKEDIEAKLRQINSSLEASEPQLRALSKERDKRQQAYIDQQAFYNQIAEELTTRSGLYNQQNIVFHQQQNKLSGILKDLEYRESQQENLQARIDQYSSEHESTQAAIKETLQHVDDSDEDLIAMYAQKDSLEKALQEQEQAHYGLRGKINEDETKVIQLRKNKEQADLILNEIKDKKTQLKLELNALKERLAIEFEVDIRDLIEGEATVSTEQGPDGEEMLMEQTRKLKKQLDEFGTINPMAMEAYGEMEQRYRFINKEKEDLLDAKASLLDTIQEIEDIAKDQFMQAFLTVREHFITVFRSLFNEEDSCDLVLTDPGSPLESDIDILARPKGKRPLSINQLSGGEKTLTATALLFSLYLLKPAPFCIFDEVDAPLDDTNIDKFNNIIRKFSTHSQFIVVSHNKKTIASTDIIYGVTMLEQGISRVVAVDMREV